jgi:hypothetical protein
MVKQTQLKILEYIEKYKYELDKLYIIILCYLVKYTEFDYDDLKQLLKGAYFLIENDNGFFYNKLKEYSNRRKDNLKHKSSHYSCRKIHRIGKYKIYSTNGHINKNYDCIIGKICMDKGGSTIEKRHELCNSWIQFEKTRTDTTFNKIKHSFDYIKHRITNHNVGPFGYSKNTENKPIILHFNKN